MNNKRIMCNWCKIPQEKPYIFKYKNGMMNYCWDCRRFVNAGLMPDDINPIDHEEFNKGLKRLFNAPPLTLKDLKARLKKEQEEKQDSKKKSEDKKGVK